MHPAGPDNGVRSNLFQAMNKVAVTITEVWRFAKQIDISIAQNSVFFPALQFQAEKLQNSTLLS
jgi:hypothetical protein